MNKYLSLLMSLLFPLFMGVLGVSFVVYGTKMHQKSVSKTSAPAKMNQQQTTVIKAAPVVLYADDAPFDLPLMQKETTTRRVVTDAKKLKEVIRRVMSKRPTSLPSKKKTSMLPEVLVRAKRKPTSRPTSRSVVPNLFWMPSAP